MEIVGECLTAWAYTLSIFDWLLRNSLCLTIKLGNIMMTDEFSGAIELVQLVDRGIKSRDVDRSNDRDYLKENHGAKRDSG